MFQTLAERGIKVSKIQVVRAVHIGPQIIDSKAYSLGNLEGSLQRLDPSYAIGSAKEAVLYKSYNRANQTAESSFSTD